MDQQPYIVKEFEIETIPTIFIYVDGQLEYTEETDHTFKAKIDIFHIQQEIDKWN